MSLCVTVARLMEPGCDGGATSVGTNTARIQLGGEQELPPAPGIKDFSSLLRSGLGDMQRKTNFSHVLVAGDAKGPGGPLCS